MSGLTASRPGLLRQVRSWSLPPGASASPGLTFAGLFLLSLCECALLGWSGAVCRDVVVWGLPWWQAAVAIVLAVVGSWHGWCLWGALRQPGLPVTLSWLGPLPKPDPMAAASPAAPFGSPPKPLAHGWQVHEWAEPVEVRLVLDAQRWMLLQVCSLPGKSPVRHHWSWVSGRHTDASHRLRALLALPASMTRHVAPGPVTGQWLTWPGKRSMASWAGRARFGAAASAHTMNTMPSRRSGVDPHGGHQGGGLEGMVAAPSQQEADFPLTEILPERRPS